MNNLGNNKYAHVIDVLDVVRTHELKAHINQEPAILGLRSVPFLVPVEKEGRGGGGGGYL